MKMKQGLFALVLAFGWVFTACAGQEAVVAPTPEPTTPVATSAPTLQPTPSPSPKPYWADWEIRLSPTEVVDSMPEGRTACTDEEADLLVAEYIMGGDEYERELIYDENGYSRCVIKKKLKQEPYHVFFTQGGSNLYKADDEYFYGVSLYDTIIENGNTATVFRTYINVETMRIYAELAFEEGYEKYMAAPWPENDALNRGT